MNKLFSILAIGFILIQTCTYAQVGNQFPDIEAVDLNDKAIKIPEDTKGKFTLIGMAFSENAQKDLYTWSQPVYSNFIDENNLASLVYNPNVHLVLMFTGAKRAIFEKAKKKIIEGTDETLKDNVVLYKGIVGDYRKSLGIKDKKSPYFFVLDHEGKIIYATSGRYSMKKLEEVGDLIEE